MLPRSGRQGYAGISLAFAAGFLTGTGGHDTMGEITNIHCTFCNADWDCRVGSGMLHGSLESVAALFPEKQKEEIARYENQMPSPNFTFSLRAACCKHCREIVSIPVLIMTETGTVFTAPCPSCGTKLKPIARPSICACPVCGKTALKSEMIGRWD